MPIGAVLEFVVGINVEALLKASVILVIRS